MDFSNQGHIYIAEERRRPRTDNVYDTRSLTEIRTQGLDSIHHSLDSIKPFSQTVFHEVTVTTESVSQSQTTANPLCSSYTLQVDVSCL